MERANSGVVFSLPLNQRLAKLSNCSFSSLQSLDFERVSSNVLIALVSQCSSVFAQLTKLSILYITSIRLKDAFLVYKILQKCVMLKKFDACFQDTRSHCLTLVLDQLGCMGSLKSTKASNMLYLASEFSGMKEALLEEGYRFFRVAFQQMKIALDISNDRRVLRHRFES